MYVAKTKALISCAFTVQLICVFVFAYAKSRFSHNEAPISDTSTYSVYAIQFICDVTQLFLLLCHLTFHNLKGLCVFIVSPDRLKWDTIKMNKMSRVMRKPTFCICENKDADQLRGNREADQRLCFRYVDSTIPLLSKSEMSSLYLSSVAVQPGLCRTRSETRMLVFSWRGSLINQTQTFFIVLFSRRGSYNGAVQRK